MNGIEERLRERAEAEVDTVVGFIDPRLIADDELISRLTPKNGRLLVTKPRDTRDEGREVRIGGVIVPDIALQREPVLISQVIKVAEDLTNDPDLRPGVHVLIPEFGGLEVFVGRETNLWVIGRDEVLLVVDLEDRKGEEARE